MHNRCGVAAVAGVVVAASLWALPLLAQPKDSAGTAPANNYRVLPHSDSQFAHELLRLMQPDLIKVEEQRTKGSPAENLWKAQELVATWEQIAKSRSDSIKATAQYLASLNTYLNSTTEGIDGLWAMDHAKFVFGKLSEPVLNRMEYWSNGPKDRAALAPMADLADRLMKQAKISLDAGMSSAEAPGRVFDEAAYMRNYSATSEVEYYNAWGQYFKAMAMEPGTKERKDLLLGAATILGKWADDDNDNGVNKQALLLRGKARSETGDSANLTKAVEDLNKASVDGPGETVKAPEWVKYQAKYQIIVTRIRARDFPAAYTELEAFKKGLPQGSVEAQMSTNMLGYRIAWAEADTKEGKAKTDGQVKALGILAGIIHEDPRFRDLIYEQLTAQIPDGADLKTLMPMQQLAIAYSKSTGQKGETPESRAQLQSAINAALEVRKNPVATASEKLEGTYLAGVCSAVLNQLQDAVKYSVEFVSTAPNDPRSKELLNVAMQQIGQLKATAKTTGQPLAAEMNNLIEAALALSTGKFKDPRFRYAQGRTYEENGKLLEAAKAYAEIPADDKNYIDARYRLVAIATTRLSQLTAAKAPPAEIGDGANDLFKACSQFVTLLDNPPKNMPAEFLERAKTYRTDILMIETATALNPAVKRPQVALDRLDKLDQAKDQFTDLQKGAILRYRIEAYQMSGQMDKIMPLLQGYADATKQNPIAVFQGLALSTVQEIEQAEKTDPAQAKRLADFVVKLFDPIIEQEIKDGKSAGDQKTKDEHNKNAFDLKQVKADMMLRAGDFKGADALCDALIEENKTDIRSFMTQARARFLKAEAGKDPKDYAYAQDYFTLHLAKITPGVDAYWEFWLRILQCKEAQGGPGAVEDIKKHLSDLKASTSKFGGEKFKEQFAGLAAKYGVP